MTRQQAVYTLMVLVNDPDHCFRKAAFMLGLDGYFIYPDEEAMDAVKRAAGALADSPTRSAAKTANEEIDIAEDHDTRLMIFRRYMPRV